MKLKSTRAACLLLALCMCLTLLPMQVRAATALPDDLYLAQNTSGTCTLSSAAMMLRARMYLSGNSDWRQITESAIRSTAWASGAGLRWSFTYTINGSSMSVKHTAVSGGISASDLKDLLDLHPEGIVLYCGNLPHAVFLTDYDNDTFYCADPAGYCSGSRIPLTSSYLGKMYGSQTTILNSVTAYWYISSYSIADETPSQELPNGAIDCIDVTAQEITVYGWAFDTDDVSRSVKIQVYLGNTFIGEAVADVSREDVDAFYGAGEYHGYEFSCAIPSGCTGEQTVTIYALDTETDALVSLGSAEVEIPTEDSEDPVTETPEGSESPGVPEDSDSTVIAPGSLGDVNGDGEINIFDANLIVAYYNETIDLTEAQLLAADVNGNGEIDIFDANLIVAYYNDTIETFPKA